MEAIAPGLFELEGDGSIVLIGGFSPISGRHHFPLGPVCPFTGADDVRPARLPQDGHLWTWTAVTHPPPGYEGPIPYGFGVVELDGIGLRIVTRLTESDPSRLHEGQRMTLVTDEVAEGVATWAFAPVPA
jgi:uncharacterized OB-fold protein